MKLKDPIEFIHESKSTIDSAAFLGEPLLAAKAPSPRAASNLSESRSSLFHIRHNRCNTSMCFTFPFSASSDDATFSTHALVECHAENVWIRAPDGASPDIR